MNEKAVQSDLPVGATVRHREPVKDKSLKLAEQLARRGASESLVRAIGGDEAVEKLMGVEKTEVEETRDPSPA